MVFEYEDYRSFLVRTIDENKQTRGYQSRLSEAAGCQPSYLTHVLKGRAELTPDQALGLCQYWELGSEGTEYFLDLVLLARAATPALQQLQMDKLVRARRRREEVAERINYDHYPMSESQLIQYYSSWYWAAIHMCFHLSEFDSTTKVASKLGLPVNLVEEVTEELLNWGFLQEKKSYGICAAQVNFHLPKNAIYFQRQHYHWRQKVASCSNLYSPKELHFTSVFTISKKDYKVLKEQLMQFIKSMRKTIADSKEEDLAYVTLDLGSINELNDQSSQFPTF